MDSKKYIDTITLEYLSRSRNKNNKINISLTSDDIYFYKKRIINTTREFIKKSIDLSYNQNDNIINNIINNNSVEEAYINYINTLIYAYKQDDIKDIINNNNIIENNTIRDNIIRDNTIRDNTIRDNIIKDKKFNGVIDNLDVSNNSASNINTENTIHKIENTIHKIDNNLFKKSSNIKNKYDWNQFCKIEKKDNNIPLYHMPEIKEYNIKDPKLRNKGIKNKKSNNNIVN